MSWWKLDGDNIDQIKIAILNAEKHVHNKT